MVIPQTYACGTLFRVNEHVECSLVLDYANQMFDAVGAKAEKYVAHFPITQLPSEICLIGAAQAAYKVTGDLYNTLSDAIGTLQKEAGSGIAFLKQIQRSNLVKV